MAKIEMTLDEWNQHVAENARLSGECAALQKKLDEARSNALATACADVARLEVLVRAAMTLTTFAAGNLPPEMTPNWPYGSLVDVINNMSAMPTFGSNDDSLRIELTAMADEILRHNRRRALAALVGTTPTAEAMVQITDAQS